jgi:quinol monooxygenase YgiN
VIVSSRFNRSSRLRNLVVAVLTVGRPDSKSSLSRTVEFPVMKFARNVHFQIKNGKEQEFKTLFEKDVLPMLRKQNGFLEELTLVNKDGAIGISLWDDRKNAEAYQISTYPKVVETLQPLLVGTPRLETYEVGVTTLEFVTA